MWARVKDTEVLELTRSNDLKNSWSWKIKYSEIFFNISVNSIILGIVVSYKIDNSSSFSSGMFCWLTALDVVHLSLFFTAFCEDKSCEYFVNSGVHHVQLHAEDVEGGGVDVQEREVGEDVRIRIHVHQDEEVGKEEEAHSLPPLIPLILSSPGGFHFTTQLIPHVKNIYISGYWYMDIDMVFPI